MKINEIESLVGITKKNIRFYEEQKLLSPRRNSENGYRDYSAEDVKILQQIKLLRKLGVPIEEIRQMLTGIHTVGDGMRRHLISLEREQRNLEQSISLCRSLQTKDIPIASLDTETLLAQMDVLEKNGASFQNKQNQDMRVRYIAPVIVTVIMVGLMFGVTTLLIWAYVTFPQDSPPLWFLGLTIAVCVAIAAGMVLALTQRIKEIGKGEIDDARHY